MKLLVAFRHRKAIEPFVDLVLALLARGHEVTVGVHERDEKVRALFPHPEALSFVTLPDGRRDEWTDPAELARHTRDLAQYLLAPYHGASKLRHRVFERLLKHLGAPAQLSREWSADGLLALGSDPAGRLAAALQQLERLTPPDPVSLEMLRQLRPDAVLVTPLVHFGSTQVEIVKAARASSIPVGMLLFSWDNLSTKGALHAEPDHLFVWNENQRREARELHGFDEKRVSVTGAGRFDRFFRLQSRVDPAAFRTSLGATESVPVILYVCSSRLVSEKEINFIRQWRRAVRSSPHKPLRRALLIVRPHPDLPLAEGPWIGPERTIRWPGFAPEARVRPLFDDPQTLTLTSDYGAQDMLFESIYQSVAVVGLNTSAEIEAGIVGRPVFTILSDLQHADGQHTTLHFHYLTEAHGGFVNVAASLDEHVSALASALDAPPPAGEVHRRVAPFIRPLGWTKPASDMLADAIETVMPSAASAAAQSPTPVHTTAPQTHIADLDEESRAVMTALSGRFPAGAVLYDLSAASGAFTVATAKQFGWTVIAFESNLPALLALWQRTLAEGCQGLVVPLLLKPGMRSALHQERYDRLAADASRLTLRTAAWKEHDAPAGGEVIQPVMSVPLEWAMRRWKLPMPTIVRAVVGPRDRDLVEAIVSLTSDPRLSTIALQGDESQLSDARVRLHAAGFESDPSTGTGPLVLRRVSPPVGAAADSPHARLQ